MEEHVGDAGTGLSFTTWWSAPARGCGARPNRDEGGCTPDHHERARAAVTESDAVDLIHLEDADGDHCTVRVTGRFKPGVLTGHDILRADVLAHADFVDARLGLHLLQRDLDAWQRKLTGLAPGTEAGIGGDRGPSLVLHMHEDRSLSVTLHDPDRLSAVLWIRPQEKWIDEHHDRLEQVRQTWPSEVVETAPMTYEWRPARRS
ncbi:hypothetical protein ADZ36_09530 [Streptomyces fradiae]|uniref:Uncharacterized protein n=2 Tax=Streptomyces TaxID=1883 RepID=A0A3R7ENC6_9ACTN|nr:hypothetical protein ADZ36_09530 [Streptomyces fradiae]OFA52356.1 hypothetical protein BEN35_11865 [Streptomyces fradiae]PQM21024.1 hypothetical protein Sfr7A_23560 [Streptomyces xinghaiensis]RKM92878.1 hypothetical protein SFRA_023510 [Streptomyces xinghaiensis]RNC72466.1 hypothetical protein DC095_019000 [Streptomyces xinghaiensis]